MATLQVNPPETFDFKTPENWLKWIRRFERFRITSKLNTKDGSMQVSTLFHTTSMGDEADDILSTFRLSDQELRDFDVVKQS